MKFVSVPALQKGATIVEFAFSKKQNTTSLETAELIGIVAAYISRGYYTAEIEERLGDVLGPEIASNAKEIFQMFEDWNGRGLWTQGAALEDIAFTDDKLKKMYPHVCMDMRRPADVDDIHERQFVPL
ncbi:hypothetical protein [Sphingomonas oligophenolica]|uniref:hypothetical protein n=1 Tax=Sphingomonas oligophenolica TaxID=301154 RepID=UPI00112EF031|nr:hypothetical protein [Sphingomonas oligophenolica]